MEALVYECGNSETNQECRLRGDEKRLISCPIQRGQFQATPFAATFFGHPVPLLRPGGPRQNRRLIPDAFLQQTLKQGAPAGLKHSIKAKTQVVMLLVLLN